MKNSILLDKVQAHMKLTEGMRICYPELSNIGHRPKFVVEVYKSKSGKSLKVIVYHPNNNRKVLDETFSGISKVAKVNAQLVKYNLTLYYTADPFSAILRPIIYCPYSTMADRLDSCGAESHSILPKEEALELEAVLSNLATDLRDKSHE